MPSFLHIHLYFLLSFFCFTFFAFQSLHFAIIYVKLLLPVQGHLNKCLSNIIILQNGEKINNNSVNFILNFLYTSAFYSLIILPSVDIVITCHGMNLPLFLSAVFTAFSVPPQQGTSILTTLTLLMSFAAMISVSFSL